MPKIPHLTIPVFTDEQAEHLTVLNEALRIFQNREPVRGDMWRQYPPSDKFRYLDEKLARAKNAYVALQRLGHGGTDDDQQLFIGECQDAALDSINFWVFWLREIREGQRG